MRRFEMHPRQNATKRDIKFQQMQKQLATIIEKADS